MTIALILLALVALGLAAGTLTTIVRDGHGRLTPPRSRPRDLFDPSLHV